MKEVSTFEAECSGCNMKFARPSLGDMSYGEIIFSTIDGKHYVLANAFSEFPKKVEGFISSTKAGGFWQAIAILADPVNGQKLTPKICCPNCSSSNLNYWDGPQVGSIYISEITYVRAMALTDHELCNTLAKAGQNS